MQLTDINPRITKPVPFETLAGPCYFMYGGDFYSLSDDGKVFALETDGVEDVGSLLPATPVQPVNITEIQYECK